MVCGNIYGSPPQTLSHLVTASEPVTTTRSDVARSSLDEEELLSCITERHEPGATIRPGQLEKSTQSGFSITMAVTRSSRTPSYTSYSKKVKPCHVHNEPPANSPKSISIEPRPPRYRISFSPSRTQKT
ncbi:hypothetical protein QL093DRAFT_2579417 [Fusarium oxysporum]|nr:hypothetical protein QL093DRAFT_2579417 [Fusarium oxysporum]